MAAWLAGRVAGDWAGGDDSGMRGWGWAGGDDSCRTSPCLVPLLVPASARVAGRGWLGYGEGGEDTIEFEPGWP